MDSLIAAASRALAEGDALGALKRVALRGDPPALALRGIAMAQLGELARSRELLRRAAHGFGAREDAARARCVVAAAEVALALRELGGSPRALAAAAAALEARADHANAMQARLIAARRLLLLGRLDETAAALAPLLATFAPGGEPRTPLAAAPSRSPHGLPPSLEAVAALAAAELALRRLRIDEARAALERALDAAGRANVPAVHAEVADACAALAQPAARAIVGGSERTLRLDEVAALFSSGALVLDACRHALRCRGVVVALARRPVPFALARALAEAWPGSVDREALIARAFRTRRPDETHRARLRVEIGRLRKLAVGLTGIAATARGFVLAPHDARRVVVLVPPIDGDEASLVALLADGAAWSTSALALALGASQRTVQRALASLESAGRARSIGRARAQRWLAPPIVGFTSTLLLPMA